MTTPKSTEMREIDTIKNLKHIINAETSWQSIINWIILWKLFGGWVGYLAAFFIIGNVITLYKAGSKLPKNYYD